MIRIGSLIFFTFMLFAPQTFANEKPEGYVFAELFTSQSCSSCPAADKVLESLGQNDNVITLSCHVTYWDHLDWKDTLSKGFCTRRQKAYSPFLGNKGRVYTPQLVVNGKQGMVGSDKPLVIEAISKAAQTPLPVLESKVMPDRKIAVKFPPLPRGVNDLILMTYNSKHTQDIASGENRGRTVTYTNSILSMTHLGIWNGDKREEEFRISKKGLRGDGAILVAQSIKNKEIVAVGKLQF